MEQKIWLNIHFTKWSKDLAQYPLYKVEQRFGSTFPKG